MISKLSLLLLLASVGAIPIDHFFPFNGEKVCLVDDVTGLIHTSNVLDCYGRAFSDIDPSQCNEFRLNPNDDGSSHEMSLSVTFPFFGKRFQNVYVSLVAITSLLWYLVVYP